MARRYFSVGRSELARFVSDSFELLVVSWGAESYEPIYYCIFCSESCYCSREPEFMYVLMYIISMEG